MTSDLATVTRERDELLDLLRAQRDWLKYEAYIDTREDDEPERDPREPR